MYYFLSIQNFPIDLILSTRIPFIETYFSQRLTTPGGGCSSGYTHFNTAYSIYRDITHWTKLFCSFSHNDKVRERDARLLVKEWAEARQNDTMSLSFLDELLNENPRF